MLSIDTFDHVRGGNVLYKALTHPWVAERLPQWGAMLTRNGPVALYDPDGLADALLALCPQLRFEGVYVQDTLAVGEVRAGQVTRPLSALRTNRAATLLIAAFDAARLCERLASMLPESRDLVTLDQLRLPESCVTRHARYLDPLNFATNFAFFRDDDHFATRLTAVNYWHGYGASEVRWVLRLYGADGEQLVHWEQPVQSGPRTIVIDSTEVRRRFALRAFTGQLFIHVVGAAGHDVVKYTLDTYATDGGKSLSCSHDANAWPAEFYAGLPAPALGERVTLWVQNSHAQPIPSGTLTLDRMGAGDPVAIDEEVPGFGTRPIDVGHYLPHVEWPAQLELRAGRHMVRPRYEVTRHARVRIAHLNVERTDLQPDPHLPRLSPELGRGYLLPFPILPRNDYRTLVLPNPMAQSETQTPLRLDVFAADGSPVLQHFLGVLPRRHDCGVDLDALLTAGQLTQGGHAELVYDFRDGGSANGWLHALFRYEQRHCAHVAECSFGAHMFNTLMTYRNEPQSYSGPPPGLSTRLCLRLGDYDSFGVLIYPASTRWRARSQTTLELHDSDGRLRDIRELQIACSGSSWIRPRELFDVAALRDAGTGYVLIRDSTCRLFGYQGQDDGAGRFCLDHMFGF
jgi:hypothetical protein